jgi:hypothetical protein
MNCSQKKIAHSSKETTMPNMKKPAVKKTATKAPTKKTPMSLTGPAAVEALQRRVSPAGVRQAEAGAKKAIAKKYPGLTKKK